MLKIDLSKTQTAFESLSRHLIQEKKSLVFLVSDFYEKDDYASIAHKNQINALIVRDKLEENPNFGVRINLIDTQNKQSIEKTMHKKSAEKYAESFKNYDDSLLRNFGKHKINCGKIYTQDNVFIKLSEILK
jgi:hypothetical protein